jgi:hypothetical protein
MRAPAFFLLCAAAGSLPGCALEPTGDSIDVSTRDLTISLIAADEGSGAAVTIRLSSIIGPVRLAGGDSLRLTAAGTERPLREEEHEGATLYVADLENVSGDLVLDLERPDDRSVRGLTATLPPPFTLASQGISAGQPLLLTWDPGPGGYDILLWIEGDCIRTLSRSLAVDTGSYAVDPAEFQRVSPSAPATCPLLVSMTRSFSVQAPLVPPLQGGWFHASATQRRALEVAWEP